MKVEVNAEFLAMILARNKVEKKYKSLGFSPYRQILTEFVGEVFTDEAKKDFEKHYNYFFETIINQNENIEDKEFKL